MEETPKVLVIVQDGMANIYHRGIETENVKLIDLDTQDEEEEEDVYAAIDKATVDFPEVAIFLPNEE